MGLRIATNVASINAQKNLKTNADNLSRSLARLSSGYRINQSADDAAGLAISENLRAQLRGMKQAWRNANDGVSLVQIAEGGLNEISNILSRFRELGIQAASDTIGDTERKFVDVEYQQLKSELQRIAESTAFNGRDLLNGTGGMMDVQVGIYNDDFKDRISFNTAGANATLTALGMHTEAVGTKEQAQRSIAAVDNAIVSVNAIRANFGAVQNRLNSIIQNLSISEENVSAANSRIRDTDVAEESSQVARNSILQQAAVSVIQQANQMPALALKLLS
nr:Bacterial flagellin N-terminal helical region [uncultured bacterium]AIA17943.1 Bacterial flagellin N-terminal helical region [uncultured bacterium]